MIPVLDFVRVWKLKRGAWVDEQIKTNFAATKGRELFPKTLKGISPPPKPTKRGATPVTTTNRGAPGAPWTMPSGDENTKTGPMSLRTPPRQPYPWNDMKAYVAVFIEARAIRQRGSELAINEIWDKFWQDSASKSLAAYEPKQPPTLADITTRLKAIVLNPITPHALGIADKVLFNAAVRSCEHVASIMTHKSLPGDLMRLKSWSKNVWAEFDAEARKVAGKMRTPEQEQFKRTKY
ncbi:hypothetical protein F5B19DRAFT_494065 [Rostrohypoxylon terebratum]|nr:hypothetical protein F5B19DRAFT_494065 [Rostrohypoxylon terebratum]